MPNGPSASSSDDLSRARALSEALRDGAPFPADEGGWIRFRAATVAPPRPAATASAPTLPPLDLPEGEPPERRRPRLLDWCRRAAHAEAVLAVDADGVLLAMSGPLPPTEALDLGVHLRAALSAAGRMAPEADPPPALAVDFGPVWLTGFGVSLDAGGTATLGFVAKAVLPADLRDAIAGVVTRHL